MMPVTSDRDRGEPWKLLTPWKSEPTHIHWNMFSLDDDEISFHKIVKGNSPVFQPSFFHDKK